MIGDYTDLQEFKTHKGSADVPRQESVLNEALKKCEEDILRSDMINTIVNLINRIITRNF